MFHTLFYEPIYNLLVFVLTIVPLHDVGIAIILVTCIVRGIILPLNLSATKSQYAIKKVEDEINKIREKHKENPQEMSKNMMAIYKREGINPFASFFVILIQLPIIIALYFVFKDGIQIDEESLYSFLSFPQTLHTHAFGILDVTSKSIVIALTTGVSAYVLAKRQTSTMVSKKQPHEQSFQDHFMKSMKIQLLYVLPVIIGFSAAVLPAAVGLYWTTSNIVSYLQDVYIKRKYQFN
jgi:YidC/Oxa1 family membrane protein insertase